MHFSTTILAMFATAILTANAGRHSHQQRSIDIRDSEIGDQYNLYAREAWVDDEVELAVREVQVLMQKRDELLDDLAWKLYARSLDGEDLPELNARMDGIGGLGTKGGMSSGHLGTKGGISTGGMIGGMGGKGGKRGKL